MDKKSICPRCEAMFYSHESESDYCGEYCEILALNDLLYEQKKQIADLKAQVAELEKQLTDWRIAKMQSDQRAYDAEVLLNKAIAKAGDDLDKPSMICGTRTALGYVPVYCVLEKGHGGDHETARGYNWAKSKAKAGSKQ